MCACNHLTTFGLLASFDAATLAASSQQSQQQQQQPQPGFSGAAFQQDQQLQQQQQQARPPIARLHLDASEGELQIGPIHLAKVSLSGRLERRRRRAGAKMRRPISGRARGERAAARWPKSAEWRN